MEQKLKCCPFCGSEAEDYIFINDHAIQCKCCVVSKVGYTKTEAIEAWNTRATDPIIEQLKAALEEIAYKQPADFDAKEEYWNWDGNRDRVFEYGIAVGEHKAAQIAKKALKAAEEQV